MVTAFPAAAHVLFTQQGTLNIAGSRGNIALSVPVSAFKEWDDNGDGALSSRELQAHLGVINDQVKVGIKLDDNGDPAVLEDIILSPAFPTDVTRKKKKDEAVDQVSNILQSITSAQVENDATASHLVVEAAVQFSTAPKQPRISINLFGRAPSERFFKIVATHPGPSGNSESDVAYITPTETTRTFFASPLHTVAQFIRIGIEHVLFGYDHILFLINLLAMSFSFKRWLALLSSFTLAHGTTISLVALNFVHAPSSWVEALIAATVILVSLSHISRFRLSLRQEMAIVSCCGLIHGLGFAAAISGNGIEAGRLTETLVGFNLGIESGQLLIAVLIFVFFEILRRWSTPAILLLAQKFIGLWCLMCGSVWLILRII